TNRGIVIVAGMILGTILEKTGATLTMTQVILKIVGKKRALRAMNIAGYMVPIPVFCDSGYVILNPLNNTLAEESGISMAVMAVALSAGLYATHTMVPPRSGPIVTQFSGMPAPLRTRHIHLRPRLKVSLRSSRRSYCPSLYIAIVFKADEQTLCYSMRTIRSQSLYFGEL
ncbi:MAG: SLC13 family permease, partial [Rectinema sp.]|nr:SLC13 family permease [Rectinema sp.]